MTRPSSGRWKLVRTVLSRAVTMAAVGLVPLALVPTASAHEGAAHAGTPHWVLLGILLIGMATAIGSIALGRTRWADLPRLVLGGLLGGAILVTLGTIGLTEIQIEPLTTNATPIPRNWYPLLRLAAGVTILFASLLIGIWRLTRRKAIAVLGFLLGLWVLYPLLVPASTEYWHPLGYLLAASVPATIAIVLWRSVRPAMEETRRMSRRVGVAVGLLFTVFLLFSTGQFTLNPETGTGLPEHSFFVVTAFANPLVMWPAVEFYVPSIPLFGALSVGTVVTFVLLAGLVATNATLATDIWLRGVRVDDTRGVAGGLATSGATACCCCAPAFYGVISAVVGVSASPLYWAFLDPASPIGSIFFVVAAALMTSSAIQLAAGLARAGVCDLPSDRAARSTAS